MSKRSSTAAVLFLAVILAAGYFLSAPLLSAVGRWLIVDETPVAADAVVVLNSEVEYYPRLIEAATLVTGGWARHVLINGNRNPVNPVKKSPPPL